MSFYLNSVTLPVTKCKKPRFSCTKGATWDTGIIKIDDKEYDAHLDTSWGEYIYFQYGESNQWYKVRMRSTYMKDFEGKQYDLDPFARPSCEVLTTK